MHVPASDEVLVNGGVERYRHWRSQRTEIADLDDEQLKIIDALGLALLADYPADAPIPPPQKRGRKRKDEGGGGG